VFKQTPRQIEQSILEDGTNIVEATSYIVGNQTEVAQILVSTAIDTGKAIVSIHFGGKIDESV
jgi:hypothetical protein